MEENQESTRGPIMICATRIIKPPPARIASLGGGITLPRTIPVRSLLSGGAGVVVGALIGLLIGGFQFVLGMATGFGALGVILTTWSPVKGETLFQWLGVNFFGRTRQRKLDWDGDSLALYMGVARLHRVAVGKVHIFPGAVDVAEGSVDERGVIRSVKNRNETESRARPFDQLPGFTPLPASPLPDRMVAGMGPGIVRRGVPTPRPPRQENTNDPTSPRPVVRRRGLHGETP